MRKSLGRKFQKQEPPYVWLSKIKITSDSIVEPNHARLPKSVKLRIHELYSLSHTKPYTTLPEIQRLIQKYPNVPVLRNYLAVIYSILGYDEKTEEVVLENIKLNPDYLFAKLNYAQICLLREEYDKIPEIFDNKLNLSLVCPERKKFHISEFVSFMGIIGEYYYFTGKRVFAKDIYELLQKIDPTNRYTVELKALLYPGLIEKLVRFLSKLFTERHA